MRDLSDLEIYDLLGCSVRYGFGGIAGIHDPEIERSHRREGNFLFDTTRTPVGELTWVYQEVWEGDKCVNQRIHEFPVKTPQDLKVLTDLINRQNWRADREGYDKAAEHIGKRGAPTGWLTSSGFTDLIKFYSGLLDTFYLTTDSPAAVEEYLEACDRRDDRILDAALQLPYRLFNLGDHPTNEFTPPPILKKYVLKRWQRISERIGKAGGYVHSHWDGHSLTILPYLQESGLQGVEALTPTPMGDMTLEDIKAAVKDNIVCLDLIPAILFLDQYSMQDVLDFTRKAIDMFAPKLILGVSDELPPYGQIEKIEAISELVNNICGLAE